jgi:hypothetical protein
LRVSLFAELLDGLHGGCVPGRRSGKLGFLGPWQGGSPGGREDRDPPLESRRRRPGSHEGRRREPRKGSPAKTKPNLYTTPNQTKPLHNTHTQNAFFHHTTPPPQTKPSLFIKHVTPPSHTPTFVFRSQHSSRLKTSVKSSPQPDHNTKHLRTPNSCRIPPCQSLLLLYANFITTPSTKTYSLRNTAVSHRFKHSNRPHHSCYYATRHHAKPH